MKKIMMLMVVAMLMLAVSGNAMAYFGEGDLIRVVYSTQNGQGQEFATDLGAFNGTTPFTTNSNLTNGAFSASSVGQTDFSNMYVAYFVYDFQGANGHLWTSGGQNVNTVPANYTGAISGAFVSSSLWASGGGNTFNNTQANASSYWNQLNSSGATLGTFMDFLKSSGETSLAALNTAGSYVDQVLYYYGSDPTLGTTPVALGTIRTNADGTTSLIAPQATPIPAAAYLFGSGLLGMFGLRRKMVA